MYLTFGLRFGLRIGGTGWGFEGEVAEDLESWEMLLGSWLAAGAGRFTDTAGTGLLRMDERFDMERTFGYQSTTRPHQRV